MDFTQLRALMQAFAEIQKRVEWGGRSVGETAYNVLVRVDRIEQTLARIEARLNGDEPDEPPEAA
jgi:hypothetical protein